jgi:hypothetical protein
MTEIIQNTVVAGPRALAALEQVRPELVGLLPDQLAAITTEPFMAASVARAAVPRVMAYRVEIEKLPGFEISHLDKLELYALAMLQANADYLATSAPPQHLQQLVDQGTAMRQTLLSDVMPFVKRGVIKGDQLDSLKGPVGHVNLASDLFVIVSTFRSNWNKIAGKTSVTSDELDLAQLLAENLSQDIGEKKFSSAVIATAALRRQQVFTLLVRAYDQVRRAITYIGWDADDIDDIAPSLFAGRKRKSDVTVDPTPVVEPTVAKAAPATTADVSAATKPAVGLPGADPFIH